MKQLEWFLRAHSAEVIEAYAEDGSLHESISQKVEKLQEQVEKLQAALEFQAAAAHAAVRAMSRIRADVDSSTEQFWKNFEASVCGENIQEADGKGHPCALRRDHVGPHQDICIGQTDSQAEAEPA